MILLSLLLILVPQLPAQRIAEKEISDSLTVIANSYFRVGTIRVEQTQIRHKTAEIFIRVSPRFSQIPFRPENVRRIYAAIQQAIPPQLRKYRILCSTDHYKIDDLIPDYFRKVVDDSTRFSFRRDSVPSVVTNLSRPYKVSNGLQGRNIALWASHGWYYEQNKQRWQWQRTRVFETVEDLLTQSFVLQYIVPMLENAGAGVFLPRERCLNKNEVIVDNDLLKSDSEYSEKNALKRWRTGDSTGFANPDKYYLRGENPFRMGTYRKIPTVSGKRKLSWAEWRPEIPEEGYYGVYVSYKSEPGVVPDAHYTVYYKGGSTNFSVNQQIDGGTWVYLGNFLFSKGKNFDGRVVLTNYSTCKKGFITADAVKFGGGMGNIARCPSDSVVTFDSLAQDSVRLLKTPLSRFYPPQSSKYPRFAEGATYWLQWAGVPDSVYSRTHFKNDYSDDFQSRGFWVNYLAGGSSVLPGTKGLGVPVDLSVAFHTDAGITAGDSTIGTLGITTLTSTDGKDSFFNGKSRLLSRDLADLIQSQVVADIRRVFNPRWSSRGLWNKSYSESRVPEVPSMLFELLSHQNFADMRFGLDPRFRFLVARAVYKGILRYLSTLSNGNLTVQPLPVNRFSCSFLDKNHLILRWHPLLDSLEPQSRPEKYVLYTRVGDNSFDNGVIVNDTSVVLTLPAGRIYSFKITALNSGGESFPSEILSAYRSPGEKGLIRIINGFYRLGGPESFTVDSTYAGFVNTRDGGVGWSDNVGYTGDQYEFRRNTPYNGNDAPGFGASHANYETMVVRGNTFDYPFIHGNALKSAGYSFDSSGADAVVTGEAPLKGYSAVDVILGKQKQTFAGNGKISPDFKTFPLDLQQKIADYCLSGGNLLVSGSYVASDILQNRADTAGRNFLNKILGIRLITGNASVNGEIEVVDSPISSFHNTEFSYYTLPNEKSYNVESADAIEPAVPEGGYVITRYKENNMSSGVCVAKKYKVCTFGFPIETIKEEADLDNLMNSAMRFLVKKK